MPRMGEDTFDRVRINTGAGKYLLLPSLTSTQRDALSAENGMVIYQSTTGRIETYEADGWKVIGQVYGDSTFLKLAGGTMAGAIAMGSNKITGLAAPTADNDGARKVYVDDAIDTDIVTHAANHNAHGPVQYSGSEVFNGTSPSGTWTDLDLSSVVGANRSLVLLKVASVTQNNANLYFRTNGATDIPRPSSSSMVSIYDQDDGEANFVLLLTDTAGIIEWNADGKTTVLTLLVWVNL